jgi:predicted phage terminase large subunit-like protein
MEMNELEMPNVSVDALLNEVSYTDIAGYQPSEFALQFVEMIKLIHGGKPENKTPVVHYHMLDKFISEDDKDTINMCHRGFAKTTVKMYLIWFIALFAKLPKLGKVYYALYISDSMDNGVKKMKGRLEDTYNDSKWLQEMIPRDKLKLTVDVWDFTNVRGERFVVTGHGAQQKIRGTVMNSSRPRLALIDDIVSDEDARSDNIIEKINTTIDNAIEFALHPTKRKAIWSGTPFNSRDPLYTAIESGAYAVNLYPVCEKFPCSEEEFRGSWEDRFPYSAILKLYEKMKSKNNLEAFNQELMLRIMSEEDRLIETTDIQWYQRSKLMANKSNFNFYVTTDFATSEKKSADYSVISVWAVNKIGQWFWVDGVCKRQHMNKNIDDLFHLVHKYEPMSVGIEVSGQQGGFIQWVQGEMMERNIYFQLASENNSNQAGIRPTTQKFERFYRSVVPLFKNGMIFLPSDADDHPAIVEGTEELRLATRKGFKSKHDDWIDTLSMMTVMPIYRPSDSGGEYNLESENFEAYDTWGEYSDMGSYVV